MTRGRRWVVVLGVLVVMMALGSVGFFVASAELTVQTNSYFSQFDYSEGAVAVEIDPDEDAYYNGLFMVSGTLTQVATTLLLVTVMAGFALLAVLAQRRDDRTRVHV